jgi:hypothetical protein
MAGSARSARSARSTGSAEITGFLKFAKSDADIMAHMLAEIRGRVVAMSAPAQLMPIYRVAISAHGSDVVYKKRPTHATGVHPCSQVVFTFQQTLHGFPSFGCPTSIHSEGTDSDFRIRLFHILSRIQFENPELLNHTDAVQEYQCHLFRQLYGEQLSSIIDPGEMSEHQSKYGRQDEAFVESLDACHALRREYTLLPNSLKNAKMHFLEYADAGMQRVFLLPGISVLAAHVVSRADRLGVHCNVLTSRYGISVDCFTGIGQPAHYNVDIFEMAEATVLSSAMRRSKSTSVAEKLVRINTLYRDLMLEMSMSTVQMRRFSTAVVGVSTVLTEKCNTNDEIMDCIMTHINSGKWVNVKNGTNQMDTFFTKFEGNLSEWLVSIVGSPSPGSFIEKLLQCKIYDVLFETAKFQALCREFKMNTLHIHELAIFARKVFVLFKFSESTFYSGGNDPKIMVSSDDITGLIREHYEMMTMSQATRDKLPIAPAVFILDQVCRSCHSSDCKSTHGVDHFHHRAEGGASRRRRRRHRNRNGSKTRYRNKMENGKWKI